MINNANKHIDCNNWDEFQETEESLKLSGFENRGNFFPNNIINLMRSQGKFGDIILTTAFIPANHEKYQNMVTVFTKEPLNIPGTC